MEKVDQSKGKVMCILQARMGSRRLPGKVLLRVQGVPLLEREVKRIKRAKTVDKIVIATTTNKEDDAIENLAKRIGVDCFRGSEKDVLDRYYQCALLYPGFSSIVRRRCGSSASPSSGATLTTQAIFKKKRFQTVWTLRYSLEKRSQRRL